MGAEARRRDDHLTRPRSMQGSTSNSAQLSFELWKERAHSRSFTYMSMRMPIRIVGWCASSSVYADAAAHSHRASTPWTNFLCHAQHSAC